jgi:hypothetical protein
LNKPAFCESRGVRAVIDPGLYSSSALLQAIGRLTVKTIDRVNLEVSVFRLSNLLFLMAPPFLTRQAGEW